MNYAETINYLYSTLPMFSRMGVKAVKPDLKNTEALCSFLEHPERQFLSVHVAGTNGKGSVSHMLAAIFQEHGYKTGLYTSPHLRDFRERIRINGKMMPKRAVTAFVKRTKEITVAIKPSFFELTFAMAMDHFATENVNVAIVETGLGGRLDSTNVITPVLSVITNIGWDHTDVLGDTLDKIAFEKAGIIKKQVPVVIGEYLPETKPVFEKKAAAQNAPILFAGENFEITVPAGGKQHCALDKFTGRYSCYTLDLKGLYQQKNLATVLSSVELLKKRFHLQPPLVAKALSHVVITTGLQGRWQIINRTPLMVLDVAHNADGIRYVVQQAIATPHAVLRIVIGMVRDKDISAVLRILPKEAEYYFTNAHIPRAMPAPDLRNIAAGFGLSGDAFDSVNAAAKTALAESTSRDMILVCGSVFVVGELDTTTL